MTRIKCPKCEYLNVEGAAVCVQCGGPLPRIRVDRGAPGGGQTPGPQFQPGQIVASRYTVLNMIGRGGMGCIYRVRDNVLKEDVALKTLLPQLVRDKMVVERFFNEARIARGLSHPNIVRVHDIGLTGNTLYISMELVKGRSLRAMLEGLTPGQRLPVKLTLRIIDELCSALEYAHRQTVHRDIKPENVMVCEDGTVKLMDFGISKLMDSTRLTGTSIVMGTPFYMSPEQQRDSAGVDGRADIYSVGVMLYEILTGNVPTGIPKPASQLMREVPPALDPIVAKCVEPDPNQRFQTVTELREALQSVRALIEAKSEASYLATMPSQRIPRPKRTRKAAGALLLALIAGAAAAGLYELEMLRRAHAAAPGGVVLEAGPVTGAVPSFEAEYKRICDVVSRIRSRAAAEAERHEFLMKVVNEGDARWRLVETEASQRDPGTLVLARQALECYVAALMWPPNMVFVPPGDVTIRDMVTSGSVTVDGFFIDATEVTNAQYLQFCTETGWRAPYDLGAAPGNHPVTHVTFYDAQAYAAWAGRAINPGDERASPVKKLPTEAQWARAAYGDRGVSESFPWGDAWQEGACNSAGAQDGSPFTAPVRSFDKDKTWSGCSDMAGNVSEWTRTLFARLPYDAKDGRDDETRPYFGAQMVVRGGNYNDPQHSPLNARYGCAFETAADTLGFRCVLELPAGLDEIEGRF